MQSTRAAKVFVDREDPRKMLQSLFGGALPSGGQPPESSLAWAQSVLQSVQVDAPQDLVTATKHLRVAGPRLTLTLTLTLTLKATTFLAPGIAARFGDSGRSPPNSRQLSSTDMGVTLATRMSG